MAAASFLTHPEKKETTDEDKHTEEARSASGDPGTGVARVRPRLDRDATRGAEPDTRVNGAGGLSGRRQELDSLQLQRLQLRRLPRRDVRGIAEPSALRQQHEGRANLGGHLRPAREKALWLLCVGQAVRPESNLVRA